MINNLPFYMANSLILTLLIECALAVILKIRNKTDLLTVFLVNLLTNPLLVAVTFSAGFFFGGKIRLVLIVLLEIAAFLAEGMIYSALLRSKRINPFLLSLILNGASYISGLILNEIIY